MTILETKKYRRKINVEKAQNIAKKIFHTDWEYKLPLVIEILKLNEEIIEASLLSQNNEYELHINPNENGVTIKTGLSAAQFFNEYEEITE